MLTAEAEKRVREIAREAAEKAVLDNRVSEGQHEKLLDLEDKLNHLKKYVDELVSDASSQVEQSHEFLERKLKSLQEQIDILKIATSNLK